MEVEPWYVTGLAEGEGSFTFSRSGRAVSLYFALRTAAGSRPLLERLRHYFGNAGRIYEIPPRGERGEGALYYRVARRDELERVATHFDAYPLRGPKSAAYTIWREMLHVKQSAPRPSVTGELEELARRLSASAPRRRGHKNIGMP